MSEFSCEGKRLSFGRSFSESVDTPLMEEMRSLAVLTSGGDAQGMNAAVRAIVRMAIFNGMKAYTINEGYQGLVDGGEYIKVCEWTSVSNIIHRGGTVIGSARCKAFREREGRLKAAENLIKRGINNLAIIGGDGSLTGANIFKEEWSGYVEELVKSNRVTEEEASKCSYLNIVGLVGTIDNDMCGTDMTIGADSALHRIIEAIDCITSTAASHQRSFVLEVMGRHCGYLAQMAGIAGGADWVLIPENPPEPGWEDAMCKKIDRCRQMGRRLSLVIVSEGAVDRNNKRITSQYVKELLEKQLGHDTRITVLGHVQRGGKPSAYDRVIGCRMGAAAVLVLLQANGEIPPKMIAVQGNKLVEIPLMTCVKRTRAIDAAMTECNFQLALELRADGFRRNLKMSKRLSSCGPTDCSVNTAVALKSDPTFRFAVMNVGTPAAGVNSAIRAFVRLMGYQGHTVLGIMDGFQGLLKDDVHELGWLEVGEWGSTGGSSLGANRTKPTEEMLPEIASKFAEYKIQGLLVIGGFDGFESLIKLEEYRKHYTAFRIPLLGVAATINNNVPGSEYSIGCDTALNMIVQACDVLRQSAHASRKRVFVVETMGGYCGYLATMAALAAGADAAYIYEQKFTIADMQKDIARLTGKFKSYGAQRGLIVRSEHCNENFTSEFMCQLLAEEGKGVFIPHVNILGHLQHGDRPTPYDRIVGIKYASHAVDFLISHVQKSRSIRSGSIRANTCESACMLGIQGSKIEATPLQSLAPNVDFEHRIPKHQWWMSLRRLLCVLARHKEHLFLGEKYLREN